MGIYEEMEKYEEVNGKLNAEFFHTENGIQVSVRAKVSNNEIKALMLSLYDTISKKDKDIDPLSFFLGLAVDYIEQTEGKGEKDGNDD